MASVWGELKRRNVVKVAVAYAIVGWLLIEVASTVFPIVQLPDWTVTLVTMLLLLGFPVALILSWAYELTPTGIERTKSVPLSESISKVTGRKLDFVIIGLMAVAIVFLVMDNYVLDPTSAGSEQAVDRRSIAVLPFANQSAAEENAEFFATGMHDELLTRLAKISSLKVISRTSVMQYADTQKNMRQIGQELGVATILEGSVQRAGNMLRVNVQLIDAETDEHLWVEIYDRELLAENIFAIQSEMATAVAEALQATILPQEMARLSEIPTESTLAWELYLRGVELSNQPDEITFMPQAIEQYDRALMEDPEFALAWAALSLAHAEIYWGRIDTTESRLQMAERAVENAFELAPDLPEAHLAMAYYHYFGESDYVSALAELADAEQGMSGTPVVHQAYAGIYRRLGRWEESLERYSRAVELDPRNVDLLINQSGTYAMQRDYRLAEQTADRALDIQPDNAVVHLRKANIPLFRGGDVSLLESAAENPPVDLGRFREHMGWTAALYNRDYEVALEFLDSWDIEIFRWEAFYTPKALFYGITYDLAELPDRAEPQFQAARDHIENELATSQDNPFLLTSLGIALAGLGQHQEAINAARLAMDLAPRSQDDLRGAVIQFDAIQVLLAAEDYDTAISELDTYLGESGDWSIEGLLRDPRIDPIRENPRFLALVEKYKRQ